MRGRKRDPRQPWDPQPHPRLEFMRHLVQRRWELGIDPPAVVAKERELAGVVYRALDETRATVALAWYHAKTVTEFFATLHDQGVEALLEPTPRGKVRQIGYRHLSSGHGFIAAEVGVSLRAVVARLDDVRDGEAWAHARAAGKQWHDVRPLSDHLNALWPVARLLASETSVESVH